MAFPGSPKGEDLQPSTSSSRSPSSFTSRDSSTTMGSSESTEPTSLTIRLLREITDDFSRERLLGQGGYGKVYKGIHDNGKEIAVKLLHNNMQDPNDELFKHEFDNLMMLNHPNIVQFVGYCYETRRQHADFQGKIVFSETTYRALCFEFMHMGSLQRHLSDEAHGLDWKTRYKIIKGACEGLKYLHEGFSKPIYHLDLKPDNILLDESMTPKLADFGLSRLFGEEQTMVTYSPVGTIGYMPPEYLFQQVVSKKLDVFSMGVVITKIIAGLKGNTRSAEMPYQDFLDEVRENWRNRLEATCTSSRILEAYCEQVSICTEIGLSSMETDRHKRPSIVDIVDRLDETETMIEKAILWSENSRPSMPVKPQREKNDNLVMVEAFPRNKAIQVTETCNDFPVLVRVTGSPWRRTEEMPCPQGGLDIVLALNVWRNKVEEAVMMLVDWLRPNDRLSILFGDDFPKHVMKLTCMSDHGRGRARFEIRELGDPDRTSSRPVQAHSSHVLPEAAQILREREVEESSTRASCIILLWTGRIHKQAISKEFPVHTIAFSGCNPSDMKQVADMTSGTCSFIKDNDKNNNIKDAVALLISRIKSGAAIKITLQANEDVTISSIASGPYCNLVSSDKQSATVDLNICPGEQKNFIVFLTVPQGKEKLVTIGGGYLSSNTNKELVGMDVVVARPRRKCLPHEAIVHPKVAAELLRIQLMEGIAKQNQDLSSKSLRLLLDEIKNTYDGHAAPEEILSDLEEEVAEMTQRYGVDRESMLSSLNCQQLQRSTTKGTLPNIGAYKIQEQQREHEHTNLVKIKGFTRSKKIMGGETYNKFPVLVQVTVAPWRHGWEIPRDGVDVVAVLDISENMQGQRLELIKQAMMIVVDKLTPKDRLSIVSFQTYKHRLMELTYMSDDHGHGRDAAMFKITQLKASSGKYMGHNASAALQEGAQILRDRGAEESSSRLGCMMLLSDGKYPENLEIKISPEFPVHTFGLGADHNPSAMKYIADKTSGTYSFVDQYTSNIKDALALFITGLTSIAVTSITITLRAHNDITISSIESGNYIHHLKSDKMSGTIILEHIYAGEQKDFIVNLIVGSGTNKLMAIGGQCKGFKWSNSVAEMDICVTTPELTRSPDDLAIHPDVAAELTRIRLHNGVMDMLQTQKMTTQGLQQLWNTIKHSDEGHGAPEKTLSGLSKDVAEMNGGISGMAYMLSWLSCHRWQRATTKGTPNNSSAFRTIGQYAEEDSNLVKLETFTRSKAIPRDEACNKFPVLVRVTVAPWRHGWEMPRDGIDVIAVLDISENIHGERLELVKKAMMIMIDKLGPNDRLSIVSVQTRKNHKHHDMDLTYMSHGHGHGRDAARFKITQLEATRGMYKGQIASLALQKGAKILLDRGVDESSSRLGCMMFLSDGNYPGISRMKINLEFPVHTFGLGVDHNPNVMKYIADKTSGTYYFVKQSISIKDALALFITGLTSRAVTSITITLRAHNGIAISSIESGNYIHHLKSDKMSGTIIVRHMYAGEQKNFIVNLTVGSGMKKLLTIGGQCKGFKWNNHLAEMDVSVRRPWLTLLPGDLAICPDVAAELTRIRLQNDVLNMVEKQKMTTEGSQQLWNMIKHSVEGHVTPEETLASLSMDVAENNRDSSGMPYTLSCLSCHKSQRATTKGTPGYSSAFQTIGQYADEDPNLVKIETFTSSKAIPSDEPCNKFPVLVRVTMVPRPHSEEMPHVGVDVVAVLDASGGMQGQKLKRMKEAMMVVIDKLHAEDRLSIVSFNTYENRLTRLTYMTKHGRDVARLKINKLVAGGQGNIDAALREGAEILWWREAESSRRIGCIVFLSDCNNHEIFETEIRPEFPVHAFGLGTDHNPSMMKHIADVTSGTYSFVNEEIGTIKDALALFITDLTSVAAMSIKITLRSDEGITMSSIESGGYANHVKNNQFGTIDINNIYASEKKDFIVYLRVAEGKKKLMTIGGQYLSHNTVKHLAYTDVCVQRPGQECVPGDLAIHPEVAAELVQIRLEKGISTMLEKGPSIVGLQQVWEEIMDCEEGRGAPEETLSALSMDITEMKRDIENPKEHRKSGLPYTLSWLTSRKWQRATIKGTLANPGAIQTTGQDADGITTLQK